MGDKTSIEWTRGEDGSPGATWNPIVGCSRISEGCDHCYAIGAVARGAAMGASQHVDRHCRMWRVGKQKAGRILDRRTWDEYP